MALPIYVEEFVSVFCRFLQNFCRPKMMILPTGKAQNFLSFPTFTGPSWIQISVLFFYGVFMCVYFPFKKKYMPEYGSLVSGIGEHKQDEIAISSKMFLLLHP